MQVLFTSRPDMLMSRLILKLTDEPVSHVCILHEGYVYQSNFSGINKTDLRSFQKDYTTIISARPLDSKFNDELVSSLIKRFPEFKGSFYDLPGLAYLGSRFFLREYFGIRIPKKNLWQITGMYLCTEFVTDIIDQKQDSMITPYQLLLKMRRSGRWVDSNGLFTS